MPKIINFGCDCGCGTIRQPSNHWRMIRLNQNGWTISDWREELQDDADVKYVAGEECAHKMLSQFLSGRKESV
jgi:hypothetical protein